MKRKLFVLGLVAAGGLTFLGTKALANEYNPNTQPNPTKAGQTLQPQTQQTPDDTTYEYFELIGEDNNGFEKEYNDWVAEQVNEAPYNIASNHFYGTEIWPAFKEDYCARLKVSSKDAPENPAVQLRIDLSSEDTIKLGELDSLIMPIFKHQYKPLESLNATIDLIGEKGEILDTLTYNYGEDMEDSEHRKIISNLEKPSEMQWERQVFNEDLKRTIKEHNLEEHKIKSLRVYVEIKELGDQATNILLDEVYLYATREIIIGVEETPRKGFSRLDDVVGKGTARINYNVDKETEYEIYNSNGEKVYNRTVQPGNGAMIFGNNMPSGVYFIRKIQDDKTETGKVILLR